VVGFAFLGKGKPDATVDFCREEHAFAPELV
jgi:hypothetical protein